MIKPSLLGQKTEIENSIGLIRAVSPAIRFL
jgi:hypothetical protein